MAWLIPTLGLLFTSLLPADIISSEGWWSAISQPGTMTLDNYRAIFSDEAITGSLLTTVWIAIGATILPIVVAALAGYAFAWIDFPGRDWLFIGVVAMIVVPLQMALIPIFSLYELPAPVRHHPGPDPVPHGVRAAAGDLPAAELLRRDTG